MIEDKTDCYHETKDILHVCKELPQKNIAERVKLNNQANS